MSKHNRWVIKLFFAVAINFFLTDILLAYPAGAWRTRNTGLYSERDCIRRGFNAMRNAGLTYRKSSADSGIYARNSRTISYIICEDNGARAVIFCSGNNTDENLRICDSISLYMSR